MNAEMPEAYIQQIYSVFASYPFAPKFENRCSPITQPKHEEVQALSKSIKHISPDEISRYAFKALSTWGDETDLRHFLPRLCEMLCENSYPWEPEQLIGKILYAKYLSWPAKETDLLRLFFIAFIPRYAASHYSYVTVPFFENAAAFIGNDLMMQHWQHRADESILLLACSYLHQRSGKTGKLFSHYSFNDLFVHETMLEKLHAFFFRTSEVYLQEFISESISALEERLHSVN